ncbi:MAG: erythromycin esterase family protein [Bacteroidia bacterium]|nr:erythromycin esterase family protein [Bacteroidia bacterium]MCF8446664.1 erythromycin esterase family protein [Bacteroidia bacterium]
MKLFGIILLISISPLVVLGQTIKYPERLNKDIENSKIIALCECIHGSDQLLKSQLNLIKEVNKKEKIGFVFFERNGLYLNNSAIKTEILKLDTSIEVIGYNPGLLRSSFLLIKEDLEKSNPILWDKISLLFQKLDSNESYYWYSLNDSQYDSLIYELNNLKRLKLNLNDIKYIAQLEFDLSYFKHKKTKGDSVRDSLMFQYILREIGSENNSKAIIFGHCGHLSRVNSYRKTNLGFYLESRFKEQFLLIGNDTREIKLALKNGETRYDYNKYGLKLKDVPTEGILIPTSELRRRKYSVYLVGADFNLKRKYRLPIYKEYDWLYYFNTISVDLTNK